ncbi:MAG: hypothetical protein M1819_002864 [Sarea resinae]|nr:MAG: hypothetical protein M1819_002864 [Sarea resinae]
MTIRATRFTPEVLLSAPRRSSGVPNADGSHALYTLSTYSFESHSKTSEIKILNIKSGRSSLIADDEKASEPNWLGEGNEIAWLQSEEDGTTKLIACDLDNKEKRADGRVRSTYTAGTFSGPVSNLKIKQLNADTLALAVAGQAAPDGSLYNPENAPKTQSTGRVYDSVFVRHWDTYVTQNRNSIFYSTLKRSTPSSAASKGRYNLSYVANLLQATGLESPIPPFGGADHFDISPTGVIFVAKDPHVNPALNTKANLYFVPLKTFREYSAPYPTKFELPDLNGACTSPTFSPDGTQAAYLQMRENGYESDRNHVIIVRGIGQASATMEASTSWDWDHSPGSVSWSQNGQLLYLVAEEKGLGRLFSVSSQSEFGKEAPTLLTNGGTVTDVRPAGKDSDELFVSATNLIDNSVYFAVNPKEPRATKLLSSNSKGGHVFGLSSSQVSDVYFKGAGDYNVHAWVIKPSFFDESQSYPLAYLIHGGPQGAWTDSWSTRWNPAVFAEQGYVVITPNPTGSTGYGQDFCDAIKGEWGGRPYEDIVKGFEYIKENLSYVDTGRAVALGASYGGYMMNWIQGQPLGRQFKALVTHDGVFSTVAQMATDELYFPMRDLGGTLWDKRELWERWDPSRFTGNWATPHLIIHSELDYRLTPAEGLAAFNVLQQRGVESRYLTFPDENHWVLKPENSLHWHTVVLNWCNKFVGLPPYRRDEGGFDVMSKRC